MAEDYLTAEEKAQIAAEVNARWDAMTPDEFKKEYDDFQKEFIDRDEKGRFVPGAPTPNPLGRGARKVKQRSFTREQAVQDVLELFEEPITVRRGKDKMIEPSIVAVYRRLINRAVQDNDWRAIKMCIELREKYSNLRGRAMQDLFEAAQELRGRYWEVKEEIPADVLKLVELAEARAAEGMFAAG